MSEATVAEPIQATGDAVTQTSGTESADTELQDALKLLEEIDAPAETQAATETEPAAEVQEAEPSVDDELNKLLEPEAAAKAKEEARQEADAEQRRELEARQWQGVEESYRTRAARIRAHAEAVARGEIELNVQGLQEEFNAHHAQSVRVIASQYWGAFDEHVKSLPEEAAKSIETARSQGKFNSIIEYHNAITEAQVKAATAKLHTDSDINKARAEGFLKLRSHLEKLLKDDPTGEKALAVLRSRANPPASRGGAVSVSSPNPNSVLEDPAASPEARAKAFERKHGFKPS